MRSKPVLLLLMLLFLGACVDTTPFVLPDAGSNAGALDVVSPPADAADASASLPPCAACLEAPAGCAAQLATCRANPICSATLACAQSHGCFNLGDVGKIVACGYPCATQSGIVTQDDPALELAYAIFRCSAVNCSGPCGYRTLDAAPE